MTDMPNEIWLADPELAREDDKWSYETRESLAENSHVRERFTIKYIHTDEVEKMVAAAQNKGYEQGLDEADMFTPDGGMRK